jgi:hypothetical protein
VAGLLVDADDGEPRWVTVCLGPLRRVHRDPVRARRRGSRTLWAAYDREWVKEAPRFNQGEALSAEQELELCAHWGISQRQGRRAELADRDRDRLTAVPAEG